MSFYNIYKELKNTDFESFFKTVTEKDITHALKKDRLDGTDYLALLSPFAANYLEEMAQKAHRLTVQHFGRTMLLYTPLYLANYCKNQCVYCGFNTKNKQRRKQLSYQEVEAEASAIAESGLKHLIILTGDAKEISSIEYIANCVQILKRYFTSIAIEIYAVDEEEYGQLVKAGVDSMTMYQETYNETLYDEIHVKGPKKDYFYRLDAPERACKAKMRAVNIGALLGLDKWRKEAFFTGMHANYLQNKYPDVEISISLPRMRPHTGGFMPRDIVTEKDLVQFLTAFRLFMPRAGVTVSTRESAEFRNNIIPLGVTKMSAGSSTVVGGHTSEAKDGGQFEISDERNVAEMKAVLKSYGYQPVLKDWQIF